MFLLLPIFGYNVLHQRILFAIIFNLVSFHCNSLILINHAVIFVCTDAVPFLKVTLSSMLGITILGLHSLVVHVIGE